MQSLRRLFHFIRPYWQLAALALLMLTALVAMDLAIPRLIQRIIDQGIAKHDRSVVISTALAMLGISAVSTVISIGNNVFSVRVGEGVARDFREALFLKIQHYSFGNLDRQKTGSLLVRLTSDISAVKTLTQISLRIGTRAPVMILGSLALMITTSRKLALTLLPLLVVTSIIIVLFITRTEPLFRRVQQKLDGVNGILQENIAGARLVKALVRADYETDRFEIANEAMTAQSIKAMQWMSLMQPGLTMCINVGVVVVIGVGGQKFASGDLSLGQIVAFSNYLLTTMTPLIMMTMLSNTWAAGLVSLRRMDEIMDTVPDVAFAKDAVALPGDVSPKVEFHNVSFTYAGAENDAVLQDISFQAAAGQTVAILGSTGAGKSTLVSLIPRFYDASSGSVWVCGHDVRTLTADSLAAHIGYVPQESVLFSGTIRDNIRYGRPNATDEEVTLAATMAQAHEFITKMREGYDSRVEQRGANFSGGQKQRLAIARALLTRPSILILDDSTSAVDVETETKIQDALARNKSDRITFVVAQRISTVTGADIILVLDRGRMVASGTHHELMINSAIYREIYDSQLGDGSFVDESEAS